MSPRAESGFTLVEVVIASVILLTGVLGVLTMVDQANSTTNSTKAREEAVALQREIVETARSIPFDQLLPTTIVSKVQHANPSLADSSGGAAGWTIRRRGFTYTVTLGVCSVDDDGDGNGTHDPALFCARGATATTAKQCHDWLGIGAGVQGTPAAATAGLGIGDCGIDLNLDGTVDNLVQASVGLCLLGTCLGATSTDKNPDDYKRIVSLVRWDQGTGGRYALQSTTVPNPGQAAAPAVTSLSTTAGLTITSSLTTTLPFVALTSRSAANVAWYLDGTAQNANTGQTPATGAGTAWAFNWNLGTVNTVSGGAPNSTEALDGSYVVAAKAFDSYGAFGHVRAVTVNLNRRVPYAPAGFIGGRNGSVVEFEWTPSKERDIEGYRVYRGTDTSNVVCTLTAQTSCRETNPPSSATLSYFMVAVDKDGSGSLREGDPSTSITVSSTSTAPEAPGSAKACPADSAGNVGLTWTASPVPPLAGEPVSYYRIYRDGTGYYDRIDRTSSGSDLTWTDRNTGGTSHTYSISAVGAQLAESPLTVAAQASSC
ncbi:MAG: prepilin-type N-terminal cleavage/methylation domain-containing protein [Actinomycetota bacterium]|nr:prepilin-type N-terminal cleavage/methylation domain-containing protein [Actinomycetota bacterium]